MMRSFSKFKFQAKRKAGKEKKTRGNGNKERERYGVRKEHGKKREKIAEQE